MTQMWDARFEAALRHVIPALSEDTPLTPDLDLAAAGINSIGLVRLMMRLEREYQTEFAFDLLNFQIFRTPETLWTAIQPVIAGAETSELQA